ncbi:MAG: hypothetical protein AAB569_00100, partial [Patescibacteria group bacterium]
QTYKCNSDIAPTQASTGGDEDYPADDSCWIVKCFEGKPNYVMYSDSLSRYEIPLSSCPNNSLYKGGGWMTIGIDNRNAKLAQLGCENGNEEITLVPTKAPTPTNPIGGGSRGKTFICSSSQSCRTPLVKYVIPGGYGYCACVTPTPPAGGGLKECPLFLNCQKKSDTTHSLKCFYDKSNPTTTVWYCDPRPVLSPTKTPTPTINPNDIQNLRCRYTNCPFPSQKFYYYREYTSKYFINEQSCQDPSNTGSSKDSVIRTVCEENLQVIQNNLTGTVLWSSEGNCTILPNGLCAVP